MRFGAGMSDLHMTVWQYALSTCVRRDNAQRLIEPRSTPLRADVGPAVFLAKRPQLRGVDRQSCDAPLPPQARQSFFKGLGPGAPYDAFVPNKHELDKAPTSPQFQREFN